DAGQVATYQREEVRRFRMRIVPDREMPSALHLSAFNEVTVREQDRGVSFIGLDARRVDGHNIRPIGKISDAAKAFGFALRAIGSVRAIKARELGIGRWIYDRLNFERKWHIRRLRNR